jgi:hypothetical protein
MTGSEHYKEAERLLVHTDRSVKDQFGDGAECARQQIAMAQVHATLALASATALGSSGGLPADDWDAWRAASATVAGRK